MSPNIQGRRIYKNDVFFGTSEVTDGDDARILNEFYQSYDSSFILANEKETLDGFIECLALNSNATGTALRTRYGYFREMVLITKDRDGHISGGANFILFSLGKTATVNINYIYVTPDHRGLGWLREIVASIEWSVQQEIEYDSILLFIEQNDPFRLTPEDYEKDSEVSGLDQYERLKIWRRLGSRLVDHAYVQPPLSQTQSADHCLVYGVLGSTEVAIPANILADHLERFFAISVLKGRPIDSDETAHNQISALRQIHSEGKTVRLIDHEMALSKKPTQAHICTFPTFLDYAKSLQT